MKQLNGLVCDGIAFTTTGFTRGRAEHQRRAAAQQPSSTKATAASKQQQQQQQQQPLRVTLLHDSGGSDRLATTSVRNSSSGISAPQRGEQGGKPVSGPAQAQAQQLLQRTRMSTQAAGVSGKRATLTTTRGSSLHHAASGTRTLYSVAETCIDASVRPS